MLFLGVDPAMTGAAVLLDQQRNALATFFWTPRQRGGSKVWEMVFALRLDGDHRFDPRAAPWVSRATVSPFGSLGERIREIIREASGGGYLLAGENAIVGRGRSTSIIVARNSGRILGPLEALAAGQEAEWVEAVRWRALLLGLPVKTPRVEAKEQSRRMMPARIKGLQEMVRLLGDADDLTDAAGVAEWLLVTTMTRDSAPSSPPKPKPARKKSSPPGASSGKKRASPRR